MRFSDLPMVDSAEGAVLGEDSNGELVRINAADIALEAFDASMISLVLSKKTTAATLLSHINNSSIHRPIDDNRASNETLWSSAKIASVISDPAQFNVTTDDIPEGGVNKYMSQQYVDSRIEQLGVNVAINYDELAGRIASLMLGFSQKPVLFELFAKTSETFDQMSFSVLPGVQSVTLSAPASNTADAHTTMPYSRLFGTFIDVRPAEVTHYNTGHYTVANDEIILPPGGSITITKTFVPLLNLDALENGDVNSFFSEDNLNDMGLLGKINRHLESDFDYYHNQIDDDDSYSANMCWSSFKTEARIREGFEAYNPRSTFKEMALIWCRANQGANATGYTWQSEQVGTLWHHYIRHPFNYSSQNDQLTWSQSGYIVLKPGRYHISWQVSEATQNIPDIQKIGTYLGTTSGWNTKLLDHSGVITVSQNTYICLWTLIVTPNPYQSLWRNAWLAPRNVPGMQEVYSSLFVERIQ